MNNLAYQKRRLGEKAPLAHSFDMLCGTSVGSILAAALAAGVEPQRVVDQMQQNGEDIFPKRRFFSTAPGVGGARFSPAPLKRVLDNILGETTLGDVSQALVIPAYNVSKGAPEVFRSYDKGQARIKLVDVVLASAAAPTYFPLHEIDDNFYADGGLVANGPALTASTDLARLFSVPLERQRIVTIGTTSGEPGIAVKDKSKGALGWFWPDGQLLDVILDGQVDLQRELMLGLNPMMHISLDQKLTGEQFNHVHLVKADGLAQRTLAQAADACVSRVTHEVRRALEDILRREGRIVGVSRPQGGREDALYLQDRV